MRNSTLIRNLSLLLLLLATVVTAESRDAKLSITPPFKPQRALVLIISGENTIEKLDTALSMVHEGVYLVGFTYDSAEVTPESRAMAIAFSEDGASAMSAVQVLTPITNTTIAEIPLCPPSRHEGQLLTSQYGLIKQLVEVRGERLVNVKQRLAEKLSQGAEKRLAGLETLFGIQYSEPIDPNADPLKLIERLSRTVMAVRFYKSNRKAAEAQAAAAAEAAEAVAN